MRRFDTSSLGWYSYQHDPDLRPRHKEPLPPREIDHSQTFPKDFEKGWEHYRHYHLCRFCGEQEHEDNLVVYDYYYWAHPACIEKDKEFMKQFKNKAQYESKDH